MLICKIAIKLKNVPFCGNKSIVYKMDESGQKFDLQYYVKYGIIISDVGIILHNN